MVVLRKYASKFMTMTLTDGTKIAGTPQRRRVVSITVWEDKPPAVAVV